ncbi:PEGA domain-containing protein [Sandaracinus amylolyticus]|uniref:PEGA domain-containing protein n=1 Tax=Sandaracinus amylolyticus TaxID=927083 RepID=A0A0F6YJ61_9BACT|nr:PEGA domain-containing protein [Sandaracinus amylolyticus]AKF07641.1 hypothetical protein DB32_004790 [Sandaracinus amylolyticus]
MIRIPRRALVLVLVALSTLVLLAPGRSFAQGGRDEARTRFARGVELYDEGRYDAALAEFQRAYDLAPAVAVLFNIAQVHAALGHAVESVDAFERYLREGGATISPERRADAEAELARQRARISTLVIEANVLGAIVAIDDVDVGTTPLGERVRVSAGERVIAVRAPGHETVTRRVRIAGGAHETVRIELIESASPRASLRVRTTLPGVEILLDDRPLGLTPFDSSVQIEAGPHRLVARRPGYRTFEQSFAAPLGSEVPIDVLMERDPHAPAGVLGEIELQLPDAEWAGTIDGVRIPARQRRIEVPIGPHDLHLEVAQRRPVQTRVEVPIASIETVRPALAWTPEAQQSGHAEIDARHAAGVSTIVLGVLLVGAGTAGYVLNQDQWRDIDAEVALVQANCTNLSAPECRALHPQFARFEDYQADINRRRQEYATIDALAIGGIALGGALALSGTILLLATPSHGDFDRGAAARVDVGVGPGSLALRASF